MTSQTKKFIELSDILTLQFECKNATCKATLTLSVSQELRKQTLFAGCTTSKLGLLCFFFLWHVS